MKSQINAILNNTPSDMIASRMTVFSGKLLVIKHYRSTGRRFSQSRIWSFSVFKIGTYFTNLKFEGPISANLLNANLRYRMSEKWIGAFGSWVDLSDESNFGQRLGLTRIGESFLVGISLNIDNNKDNVGVNFMVEPRFLPINSRSRFERLGIAPAGARGLE